MSKMLERVQKWDSLSYDQSVCIVWSEEVVIAIRFSRLSSILSNVEDPGIDSNPIQITGQLLSDVCLASGGQTNHCDHMRNVDISGGAVA